MTNKPIQQNSTDNSVVIRALNTTDSSANTAITSATSGLEIRWWTEGGVVTTQSAVSQTSTGAHVDGGIAHKHAGAYRVDVPDAISTNLGTVYVSLGGVASTVFSVAQLHVVGYSPTSDNTDDVAQAVMSLAQTTPIEANVVEMNSAPVIGDGTESDLWRGVE